MKIVVRASGMDLTPAISSYAEKKIATVEKYLNSDDTESAIAQVEVGKSTGHHKAGNIFRAEVHITGGGLDLYTVSEMDDLYAAIDTVKDEIIHNMLQLKGKRQTLARKSAEMMKNMMKGISAGTAKGFSWGIERMKFKNFRKK